MIMIKGEDDICCSHLFFMTVRLCEQVHMSIGLYDKKRE